MKIKAIGAVAALAFLAGCVSNIQTVSTAKGTGSPFTQDLTEQYKAFTADEAGEYDWSNANYFAKKGLAAASGQVVQPEQLSDWDIPADKQADLAAARQRLVTDLDGGARDAKPDVAAKAQVKFDCWVEEQDENHEDDKIAACKNDTLAALDELEKKEMAAAPAVSSPMNYTVYFDFDKSVITPAGQQVINQVLSDAQAHNPSSISVTGHTDLVGPEDYNMALSLRRADAVRSALIAGGVSADKITVAGRGMSEPAVPTARGVKEARNRRAEIILEP
ncbi:MAG TPA: OmpA family protein [Chloroflexota bacterium]|nr:OmpA family protein [Chloroflexota bacterium]